MHQRTLAILAVLPGLNLKKLATEAGEYRGALHNGICERFHKTLQDEFYATAFRKTLYTTLDQLQADLDQYLDEYNRDRPHSGKYCFGKTPLQCFLDSRQLAWDKILDQPSPATVAVAS